MMSVVFDKSSIFLLVIQSLLRLIIEFFLGGIFSSVSIVSQLSRRQQPMTSHMLVVEENVSSCVGADCGVDFLGETQDRQP
jgi:hypothetical protein